MPQDILSSLPLVPYKMNGSSAINVPDITRRPAVNQQLLTYGGEFLDYTVKDEETPELIAYKLYDSAQYYWLVLLFNNILDPLTDWPLSTNNLDSYIAKKYPAQVLTFPRTSFLVQVGSDWEWLSLGEIFVSGSTISNSVQVVGVVKSFDPTLGTLQLSSVSNGRFNVDDQITFTDSLGQSHTVVATRVDDGPYGVHHFESPTGRVIDPLKGPPTETIYGNIVKVTQPVANIDMSTIPITDTSIQNAYANGNPANTWNFVTYFEHETRINDSKRQIKLLRPEYLQSVSQQVANLLQPK